MRSFAAVATARFRFHGDLVAWLRGSIEGQPIDRSFEGTPGIKDVIEAIGVAHPEIDVILVNGVPVDLAYRLHADDVVDVHPACDPGRPAGLPSLAGNPPVPPRFVADTHLGRLARYLRLLGFDTAYSNEAGDDELARLAASQDRVLLTRDRGLLKRRIVVFGRLVRHDDPLRQLEEVVAHFSLASWATPFARCVRCNGSILAVGRAEIDDQLEPKTRLYYDSFGQCATCGSIYWQGSHYARMQKLLEGVLHVPNASPD